MQGAGAHPAHNHPKGKPCPPFAYHRLHLWLVGYRLDALSNARRQETKLALFKMRWPRAQVMARLTIDGVR
jgi:hypothetical protein